MKRIFVALLCLIAIASAPVQAYRPDSGWYWNPGESGRGVAIEVQDDKLFVSIFTYEANGSPTFYFAAGRMATDRTFSETLYRSANGQCLGCTYRSPGVTVAGSIAITFTSPESATVTALGARMDLERYDFSGNNYFNPTLLYGEWSTTEGDPRLPTYFGERMLFATPFTNNGDNYARGSRTGNTARFTLGRCVSRAVCVVALSFSTTSDVYYTFTMDGFDRWEGLSQIVPAGGTPVVGNGFYFIANRTKSRAFVQTGVGPATTKSSGDETGLGLLEQARHAAASGPKQAMAERFAGPEVEALLADVARGLAAMKEAR